MDEHFTPVTGAEALDALWRQSAGAPVLLFKHDPYCPISARAAREMARIPQPVAVIDVAADTATAKAVTQRTGIRHESPQVILLAGGRPVWSASHFAITADAVTAALTRMGHRDTEDTEREN